jgi:hypothetical protein
MPLKIRREQLKALGAVPEAEFREQLCAFARENLGRAVESLTDQELLWRVRSGINRARSHDFSWQSSIATFVMLMLRFSPNFDEYPPIRAILDGTGEERADRLLTEIRGEDWSEVEDRYDPSGWYDFAPRAAGDEA